MLQELGFEDAVHHGDVHVEPVSAAEVLQARRFFQSCAGGRRASDSGCDVWVVGDELGGLEDCV